MFNIKLRNGKSFTCESKKTIFEAAKSHGVILEHSCLNARCRSCAVQVVSGATIDIHDDLVLTSEEKSNNWILSCNATPASDLVLDTEDLGQIEAYKKRILPAKIQTINKITETIVEVSLRLPPNSNFTYKPGQYVNILRNNLKRSYSVSNAQKDSGELSFFIKKIECGEMSKYWFKEAKVNDLLRIEGPIGSFFLRESEVDFIIFLATGTGIAPIKAILESINGFSDTISNKQIFLFYGARHEVDLFWDPSILKGIPNLQYIPVLSQPHSEGKFEKGYVQDVLLKREIQLERAQVYACGSSRMIEASRKVLRENGLSEKNFFSDAFVESN